MSQPPRRSSRISQQPSVNYSERSRRRSASIATSQRSEASSERRVRFEDNHEETSHASILEDIEVSSPARANVNDFHSDDDNGGGEGEHEDDDVEMESPVEHRDVDDDDEEEEIHSDGENFEEPELFFVAEGPHCVYYANNNEVTRGNVINAWQVFCPVYGYSTVIFSDFTNENDAETAAREHARAHNSPYGRKEGRGIHYEGFPAPREGGHEECIRERNAMNQQHQQDITRLTNVVEQLQERVHDLENRVDNDHPDVNLVNEIPTWTNGCTQAEADALFIQFNTQQAFSTALHDHMFSLIETFRNRLQAEKLREFQKICCLKLNIVTPAATATLHRNLNELIHQRRRLARERLTRTQAPAAAMISNGVPVPLYMENGVYTPVSRDVERSRRDEVEARRWPILNNAQGPQATMIAQKMANRRWNYLIVFPDGIVENC